MKKPFISTDHTAHTLLTDAHAHIGSDAELEERLSRGILSLLCISSPREADFLLSRPQPFLIPTAGIHPWNAAAYSIKEMEPILTACPVIGEIGMDSVWCDTPLPAQEDAFRRQLSLAGHQKKPVILHTKGEEARIASILKEYPGRYLVHWYSCDRYLEDYLALDCYFSIGPDVFWNPAVRAVAERVPLNRLLIETDGMSAVRWAWEERPGQDPSSAQEQAPVSILNSLSRTLQETAVIRKLPESELAVLTRTNLINGFLGFLK